MKLDLHWTTVAVLVLGFGSSPSSSEVASSYKPTCFQPPQFVLDNATLYITVIEEMVLALEWSTVIIIIEKSAGINVDPVIRRLHANYVSVSIVERDVISAAAGNGTSSKMLTDEVFHPLSNGSGCFLILGGNDFVWHLFNEISSFFKETAQNTWVSPAYAPARLRRHQLVTSEWVAVADVRDLEGWDDLLSPLEHVVILNTASRPDWSVWTSQRSGDSTSLRHVTTVSNTASSPSSLLALKGVGRAALLPNLSQGLSGRTIRVVVKQHPILVNILEDGRGNLEFTGAFIELIDVLSKYLNFSYVLQTPPENDNSWGQEQANGQWDGLIGVLSREEADLAVGPFRALTSRSQVADYTNPYGFEDTVVVFKTSETSADMDYDDFYTRPLTLELYIVMGLSMVVALLLLLLSRCAHWYMHDQREGEEEGGGEEGEMGEGGVRAVGVGLRSRRKPPVSEWLMSDVQSILAGLLNRPHENSQPLPRAGQAIMVPWLMVSVVVVSCLYSSQLTASLTVRDVKAPFTSLEELVSQKVYTWGISNGTATQTIVMNSKHEIYKKFFEGSLRFSETDPEVLTPRQDLQLQKVLNGHYAYLSGLGRYMDYWKSLYCHLEGFRVKGFLKPGVFYLQKHSPHTRLFSDALTQLQSGGLVEALVAKWTPVQKVCEVSGPSTAIQLEQTKTAFYVLGIGLALAALSVSAEIWCAQMSLRKC